MKSLKTLFAEIRAGLRLEPETPAPLPTKETLRDVRASIVGLVRGDMFYMGSMHEQGPVSRKVIVMEIEGPVAVIDQWNYADSCWAKSYLPVDLSRVRYIAYAAPEADPTDSTPIEPEFTPEGGAQ